MREGRRDGGMCEGGEERWRVQGGRGGEMEGCEVGRRDGECVKA